MKKIKNFFINLFWKLLFVVGCVVTAPIFIILIILATLSVVCALPFFLIMGSIVYDELSEMLDTIISDYNGALNKIYKHSKDEEVQ